MEPTKRNPEGLAKKSPIALRLMPEELANAKRVSTEINTSLSCLARAAYLKGLPLVIADLSTDVSIPAVSPLAGFSGGESSPSPAGFSTLAA